MPFLTLDRPFDRPTDRPMCTFRFTHITKKAAFWGLLLGIGFALNLSI
jgi:hypothetical protein